MTDKLIQLNHQKRLYGYLTVLSRFEEKWREDLSYLKSVDEISEAEVKVESELLYLFWEFMDEVYRRSLSTFQRISRNSL